MPTETAIVFLLVGFLIGFCAALALTAQRTAHAGTDTRPGGLVEGYLTMHAHTADAFAWIAFVGFGVAFGFLFLFSIFGEKK